MYHGFVRVWRKVQCGAEQKPARKLCVNMYSERTRQPQGRGACVVGQSSPQSRRDLFAHVSSDDVSQLLYNTSSESVTG